MILITYYSFAQRQRLGVLPPSRLPRRTGDSDGGCGGCTVAWTWGFEDHLSARKLWTYWAQDVISIPSARKMEHHGTSNYISLKVRNHQDSGGVPHRHRLLALAGAATWPTTVLWAEQLLPQQPWLWAWQPNGKVHHQWCPVLTVRRPTATVILFPKLSGLGRSKRTRGIHVPYKFPMGSLGAT